MSGETMSRKERSEKILKEYGVAINPHLPRIENEGEITPKTAGEVARRAVCAFFVSMAAIGALSVTDEPRKAVEYALGFLNGTDVLDEATPDEKKIIALADESVPMLSEQELSDMAWRVEMAMPLFWACGLFGGEVMDFPREMVEIDDILDLLGEYESCEAFITGVELRELSVILDNADLCFRQDWACVEARLKQDGSIMGELNPDVVVERHKGFEWLIGTDDDWDNIVPNT